MIELFFVALTTLFSARGVSLMFVILSLWAAEGGDSRVVMLATTVLYGVLMVVG